MPRQVAADQLAIEPLPVERLAVDAADAVLAQRHVGARGAADEDLIGQRGPRAQALVEHRRGTPVDPVRRLGEGARRAPVKEQVPPQDVVEVGAGRQPQPVPVLIEGGLLEPPDRARAQEDVVPHAALDESLGSRAQAAADPEIDVLRQPAGKRIPEPGEPPFVALLAALRRAEREAFLAVAHELVALVAADEQLEAVLEVRQVVVEAQTDLGLRSIRPGIERGQLDAAGDGTGVRDVGLAAEEPVEPQGGAAEGLFEEDAALVEDRRRFRPDRLAELAQRGQRGDRRRRRSGGRGRRLVPAGAAGGDDGGDRGAEEQRAAREVMAAQAHGAMVAHPLRDGACPGCA